MDASDGALHLTFDYAQGLSLQGDTNRAFAVAGADGKWHWATPQLAGTWHWPQL